MDTASKSDLQEKFSSEHLFSDLHILHYEVQSNTIIIAFQIANDTFFHRDSFSFDLTDLEPRAEFRKIAQYYCLIKAFEYSQHFLLQSIIVHDSTLNSDEEMFWQNYYDAYSLELYYSQQIPLEYLTRLIFKKRNTKQIQNFVASKKNYQASDILLGVGGGKDAIYAFETLERSGFSTDLLFTFHNTSNRQQRGLLAEFMAHKYHRKVFSVERIENPSEKIDFMIKRQKEKGIRPSAPAASSNAVRMAIVALKFGYSNIVTANEKSADFGNTMYCGKLVNHQYSKSLEFEKTFNHLLSNLFNREISYFSLLKPLYEIRIAQGFSKLDEYFPLFVSCNSSNSQWCHSCSKCAFVYSILSGFLIPKKINQIFQSNLFNEPNLIQNFQELMGITGIKPLECVGEKEEVWLSMALALELGHTGVVLDIFKKEVLPNISITDLRNTYLSVYNQSDSHLIPEKIMKNLQWL